MYGTPYAGCDSYKGVCLPSLVSYVFNCMVVFGVFMREGLFGVLWQYVNFMSCIVWVGDGSMGVDVWVGAPSIFRISSLRLAWHWHFVCEHVHGISHSGMVRSLFLLLRFHGFVSV